MFKNLEDFQKFGKEQFEAATVASSAWTKGVQQIATEASDFGKKSFEASSGLVEKLLGVKSVEKAVKTRSSLSRENRK